MSATDPELGYFTTEYFQTSDDCNNNIFYDAGGFLIGNCVVLAGTDSTESQLASCNSTTCIQYFFPNADCSGAYSSSEDVRI